MTRKARRTSLIGAFLDHRVTRFVVASLIVVSLLPYDGLERALRPWLLVAFGAEVFLRITRMGVERGRERGELLFLFIDLLAWASFLPLEHLLPVGIDTTWLRGLRLVRLLVLIRFTRYLAQDVWRVLTRREQLQQLGLVTAAVLALSFFSAVVLSHLLPADEPVPGSFWEKMWWSFRQVESPDNLVPHLDRHPLVVITSLGLTITGIFVFSYLIGVGTTVVDLVLRAERRRPVPLHAHTLVVGPMAESELLVREFVRIHEKNRALRRISPRDLWRWLTDKHHPRPRRHALPHMALLGPDAEPPAYLYEPEMRWVVYRQGDGVEEESLDLVAATLAKRAILLAPPSAVRDPDAITLSRLSAFRAENAEAHVFVEVRRSENAEVVRAVGGAGTFPLDASRVVGLFLCHHLLVPGVDRLFEELLSARGSEIYTHLYVDPWEHGALEQLAAAAGASGDGTISFRALQRFAHERHRVTLLGVFLGDRIARLERDLVPVDRLDAWVNPTDPASIEGAEALDRIPVSRLQGVFGICDTYVPLRGAARAMLEARVDPAETREGHAILDAIDRGVDPTMKRIVVVGWGSALPALVDALAHFVPGVHLHVVLGTMPPEAGRWLRRLGARAPDADGEGQDAELEGQGRLSVERCHRDELAELAAGAASGADAAIFLADLEASDSDATVSMRVLRFAKALDPQAARARTSTGRVAPLRLLVELDSRRRGAQLEGHLAITQARCASELVLVSTEQIKNYFMVHSAFVPGITAIYERLLGSRGQEVVRLPVRPAKKPGATFTFGGLRDALAERHAIPIALLVDGALVVNPPHDRRFERRALEAIYAVADMDALPELFP